MKKIKKDEEAPTVMIEGYRVTIQVTDNPLSLIDILDDLLGRQLEKI